MGLGKRGKRGASVSRLARAFGVPLAAALAVFVIAGCSGDRDSGEGRRIVAAVKRFALSHGPDACSQMTAKALRTVYGRGVEPSAESRTHCLTASKRFAGEPVSITFVKISNSTQAHATARTTHGNRYFSVALEKQHGRWLINSVIPTQRPG